MVEVAVKHLYLVLFLRHNRLKKHLNSFVEHNPLFFTGSIHSFDTVSFLLPSLKCVSWCSHAQSTQALMAPVSCIKGSLCNPLINSLWPQKRGIMKMLVKAKLLKFAYTLKYTSTTQCKYLIRRSHGNNKTICWSSNWALDWGRKVI